MTEKILNGYITTHLLGSGYAAVHVVRIDDDQLGIYEDVENTGIGRYKTRAEATKEAKNWADDEGIEFRE